MIRFYSLLTLVLLQHDFVRADLNLANSNPPPSKISGVEFPRKDPVLYRGTQEGHFNAHQAIAAMLGDDRQNLESAMFRSIREALLGRTPYLLSKMSGLKEEYIQLGLPQLIENKKSEHKQAFSEEQAIVATKEIMDSAYNLAFARTKVFDYASPNQEIFPKAFVYSTLHVEVAKIYAPHIVIFKDKKSRSLDVNYWNRVNNGKWVGTNRSYPDRGEFVSAFYIPFDSILGYQYARRNFNADWQTWRPLTADLTYIYMKQTFNDTNYVLIFDGTGLQHVVQEHEVFCSATTQFDPSAEIPSYPAVDCDLKPKLVGVLRRCSQTLPDESNCSFPAKLFNSYEASDADLTAWISSLQNHTFRNGDVLAFSKVAVEKKNSSLDFNSNSNETNLSKKKKKP